MNTPILGFTIQLLSIVAPSLLAGRRFGMARAFGALGVSLILAGLAGLMSPYWDIQSVKNSLVLSLLAWSAWIFFAPMAWSSFMDSLMGSTVGSSLMIALFSMVVPFGNLEWLALYATNRALIEYHTPIKTRQMAGGVDWRDFYLVVEDAMREQDPVLFWRSKPGVPPFSSQGFKSSIEMEVPKPSNVFRIMAYGDSNTEGSVSKDWSRDIQKILQSRSTPERKYEVINAGVGGYSSYQGFQRFLQEWQTYQPDLILVSFGWNDLSVALDHPDKAYKPASSAIANIIRTLIKYRSYLVIQHYVVSSRIQEEKKKVASRVPLDDYLENMSGFSDVGRAHDIDVVFLTRPYRATTAQILKTPNWRSRVPSYNEALSKFTWERGENLIDVQKYFELETRGLFGDETHFTREGVAEMARFLVHELDELGLLSSGQYDSGGGADQLKSGD